MYRFLRCGIEKMKCNGRCDNCPIRFKCYTEPLFYGLILTPEEWRMLLIHADKYYNEA